MSSAEIEPSQINSSHGQEHVTGGAWQRFFFELKRPFSHFNGKDAAKQQKQITIIEHHPTPLPPPPEYHPSRMGSGLEALHHERWEIHTRKAVRTPDSLTILPDENNGCPSCRRGRIISGDRLKTDKTASRYFH